jgi:hypothetical protein
MNISASSAHHIYIQKDEQNIHHFQIQASVMQGPVPSWVVPVSPAEPPLPDFPDNGVQCLLDDYQIDLASGTRFFHCALKALNRSGVEEISYLKQDFDPNVETLIFHYIEIIRDGVSIQKLNMDKIRIIQRAKELENRSFDDDLTAVLFLEDIREGDVLEFATSVIGFPSILKNKISGVFYLSDKSRAEKLYRRILKTPNQSVHMKFRTPDLKTYFIENEKECIFSFEPSSIAEDKESQEPKGYRYADVEYSSFSSWNEFARTAHEFWSANSEFDQDPNILQLINEWKLSSSSLEERASKALRFVQDEVRYLAFSGGIKGFKPADPLETFRCRFGDCKAKTQLLRSFLELLDVPSIPCLVNTKINGAVAERLPGSFFNHVILRIDLPQASIFVDPTWIDQGGDLLHTDINNYGFGLIISDDSTELTPINRPAIDLDYEKCRILKVEPSGRVEVQVISHFFGRNADIRRHRVKEEGLKKLSEQRKSNLEKTVGPLEILTPMQVEDDRASNRLETVESYWIKEPWSESSEKSREMRCAPIDIMEFLQQEVPNNRKASLALVEPMKIKETFLLIGPHTAPKSMKVDHKAFTFTCEYSGDPESEGKIEYLLSTHLDMLIPEDLEEFSKKLNEALEAAHFTMFEPLQDPVLCTSS